MRELLGDECDPRAFRAKFPEEVLQENLAGQLWFGAECLAAGSTILNREQESKEMRPLAQAVTKSLGNVRNLLREQCLRNNVPNSRTLHLDSNDASTEQLYESLKIFDRLFAEFELRYVSAMVQVKSKQEYEMQEMIGVLFSETLQRALRIGLVAQDKVDAFDPALMFSIPRLAIITGLVIYPEGPLNMDMAAEELSEMFRPFRTILIKIRDLLRNLSKRELEQLEKLLCTNEDITNLPLGRSSIEAPIPEDQQAKNTIKSSRETLVENPAGSSIATMNHQQVNNNNKTESTSVSSNSRKLHLKGDSYSSRYAASRSPSISSISADSSAPSTPTASPTPSYLLASTSSTSAVSKSLNTASVSVDSTDDDDDHELSDVGDDTDSDDEDDATNILPVDVAGGYLISNTNFGNLLQPNEVPLTDNFVASEDEYSNHNANFIESDADVPTTSAAISLTSSSLRRMRLNTSDSQTSTEDSSCEQTAHKNLKYPPESSGQYNKMCMNRCRQNSRSRRHTHHRHPHHHHHHSHRHGHHHEHSQHSKEKRRPVTNKNEDNMDMNTKTNEASSVESCSFFSLSEADSHNASLDSKTNSSVKFKYVYIQRQYILHNFCRVTVSSRTQHKFINYFLICSLNFPECRFFSVLLFQNRK